MEDLNGDGKLDIIIGLRRAGLYWWEFLSTGKVTDPWPKHTIKSTGNFYEDLKAYDLNHDGRLDIIACRDNAMYWYQNPGVGATGAWVEHFIGDGLGHEVELADMDGDGKIDVVTQFGIYFQNNQDSWTYKGLGKLKGLALLDIGSGKGAINVVLSTSAGMMWCENPREWGGNARSARWAARVIDCSTAPRSSRSPEPDSLGRPDASDRQSAQPGAGVVAGSGRSPRRLVRHVINSTTRRSTGSWWPTWTTTERSIWSSASRTSARSRWRSLYVQQRSRERVLQQRERRLHREVLETTGGQNNVVGDVDGDGDLDILSVNHGYYGAPHPIELFVNNLNSGAPPPPPPGRESASTQAAEPANDTGSRGFKQDVKRAWSDTRAGIHRAGCEIGEGARSFGRATRDAFRSGWLKVQESYTGEP